MRDTWCYLRANGGGPVYHGLNRMGALQSTGWERCATCHRSIYRTNRGDKWMLRQYIIAEWP